MTVVSNTSPISNLAVIGRLSLLRQFYKAIVVPEAVWNELSRLAHKSGLEAIQNASNAAWITKKKIAEPNLVRILSDELDSGEAEAIALAVEQRSDLILLDEAERRRIASSAGLRIKGTAGVLARAFELSILDDLRGEFAKLRNEAGFFLGSEVEEFLMNEVQKRIRKKKI